MTGSSKLNGFILELDDKSHTLQDSLIRIYFGQQKKNEQTVGHDNILPLVFSYILKEGTKNDILSSFISSVPSFSNKLEAPCYDIIVYQKAYEMYNSIHPEVFKMGKINGKYMLLIRLKSNNCLISSKIHDHENGFMIIDKEEDVYLIRFGCYRYCGKTKYIQIGSMTVDNLVVMFNDNFQPINHSRKTRTSSIGKMIKKSDHKII